MRGGRQECIANKRVVQVCNYAVIIENLDSEPAESLICPLLIDAAEDLNQLTAVVFLLFFFRVDFMGF